MLIQVKYKIKALIINSYLTSPTETYMHCWAVLIVVSWHFFVRIHYFLQNVTVVSQCLLYFIKY